MESKLKKTKKEEEKERKKRKKTKWRWRKRKKSKKMNEEEISGGPTRGLDRAIAQFSPDKIVYTP